RTHSPKLFQRVGGDRADAPITEPRDAITRRHRRGTDAANLPAILPRPFAVVFRQHLRQCRVVSGQQAIRLAAVEPRENRTVAFRLGLVPLEVSADQQIQVAAIPPLAHLVIDVPRMRAAGPPPAAARAEFPNVVRRAVSWHGSLSSRFLYST